MNLCLYAKMIVLHLNGKLITKQNAWRVDGQKI